MVMDDYYVQDAIDIRNKYFGDQEVKVGAYSLNSDFES